MARETKRYDVDPNYKANRNVNRHLALNEIHDAKLHLDNTLRGTQSEEVRTVVSTAYDLIRQAEDLIELSVALDRDYEHG